MVGGGFEGPESCMTRVYEDGIQKELLVDAGPCI
jgi:hypothetical protein